jgi:hypothetical protein
MVYVDLGGLIRDHRCKHEVNLNAGSRFDAQRLL